MKKILLSHFGINQDFPLVNFLLPDPTAKNVIIQHELIGFNPVDFKIIEGGNLISEKIKDKLPWTPGFDICGRVIKAGVDCKKFKVGDRVCGMVGFPLQGGGYATHGMANESELALVPETMDARLALTCCLSGLTALEAYENVRYSKNKILILGATGGVGFSLINISKYFRRECFGTYRNTNGHKFLSSYHSMTPISLNAIAEFFTENTSVDVIDLIGGDLMLGLMGRYKGKIKHLVTVPSSSAKIVVDAAKVHGIPAVNFIVQRSSDKISELIKIKNQNQFPLAEGVVFSLAQINKVIETYQQHEFKGKVFIDPLGV